MTSAILLSAWVALAGAQAPAPAAERAPSAVAAIQREAVVVTSVENMYSAPDAPQGRREPGAARARSSRILETRDGFARIETPDRYAGWVPASALFEYPEPEAPRYAAGGHAGRGHQPHGERLPRPRRDQGAPEDAGAAGHAPRGGSKPAEDPQKRWITVRLPSGEAAYVQSRRRAPRSSAAAPRTRGIGGRPRGHRPPLQRRAVPVGRDERARRRLLGAHQPRVRRQRHRPPPRRGHAVRRSARPRRRARGRCARATSCSSARRRSPTWGCTSATAASSTPPRTRARTCTRIPWTTPTGPPSIAGRAGPSQGGPLTTP